MSDEQVMVVQRAQLEQFKTGLVLDLAETARLLSVLDHGFRWEVRDLAEKDATKKQIIPYVLVRCGEKWFLTRRTRKQAEARLHDMVSLGVGGHINPDDGTSRWGPAPEAEDGVDDYIVGCVQREVEEELTITDSGLQPRMLGYVNDDSTEVSRHHIGLIFELPVTQESAVSIRETDKMTGAFADREQIAAAVPMMENWSALIAEGYISSAAPVE